MIPISNVAIAVAVIVVIILIALAVYMNSAPTYRFVQGMDSGGNDIMLATGLANNVEGLKQKCNETPGCIAFNTNGWIKKVVNPESTWSRWTTDPTKGMYIKEQ